jgi:signal transduction histidine kinase
MVRGGQVAEAKARGRRTFWLTAGLASVGILVAVAATVATVRAVSREMATISAREAFVAAVTHELKSPLASIRLLAELLARGGVEEEKVREFGARTVGEADRLGRLVGLILELARIEKGGPRPERHIRLDPAALAREAATAFEPQARAKGYSIEVEASNGLPSVAGDRDALLGALWNLLDNALKYSDSPHPIRVEAALDGSGAVRITVLDRGRGFPLKHKGRLFEAFARGGDELTRDRPGVGLGLALVRRVAESHGGEAGHSPREGGGSAVWIRLPAAPSEPPP